MKSINAKMLTLALTAVSGFAAMGQAAFTAGNIAVSRIGVGGTTALTGNASAVFIDEYTTTGSGVTSVALPTAASGANFTFTLGGTSTSQGQLTRSVDGRFLTIYGIDAPVGSTTPSSNSNFRGRTIAVIDNDGAVTTNTRFEASGTTARGVVTVDGSAFYVASDGGSGSPAPGGLRYVTAGSTTSGTLLNSTTTNIRTVNISRGQLYIGASTGAGGDFRGVSSVGTGLPTSATAFSLLPGFGGSNAGNSDSTYDFFFANANTLYVTDDDTTAPVSGGLQKWSFNGTAWTKVWTVNSTGATGTRSVTGRVLDDGTVELFAISSNATTDLIRVVDSSLTSTAAPTAAILASAPASTVFRGVEFVPEPTTLAALGGLVATFLRRERRNA